VIAIEITIVDFVPAQQRLDLPRVAERELGRRSLFRSRCSLPSSSGRLPVSGRERRQHRHQRYLPVRARRAVGVGKQMTPLPFSPLAVKLSFVPLAGAAEDCTEGDADRGLSECILQIVSARLSWVSRRQAR